MRCVNPFISGKAAFGCGQCMPCRFNRRRTWVHRILLEAIGHEENSFVTLTYDDAKLPKDRSLQPAHIQAWLKRFRERIKPGRIRYFAVGEYGDQDGRPHYHVAVFGYGSCERASPVNMGKGCECHRCSVVRETWGHGFTFLGTLTEASAQYTAGYVVKKMTSKDDLRLKGRYPEFARMSLRPGIGADALWDVASAMIASRSSDRLPSQLYHGKNLMPLGRYLRKRLSVVLGHSDEERASLSDQALSHLYDELSLMRDIAQATDKSVRQIFREANAPYEQALIGRQKSLERKRS